MQRSWMTTMIIALGVLAAGCMDRHRLAQPGPVAPDPKSAIVGITTRDGVEVNFDGPAAIQGVKLVAKVKHKPLYRSGTCRTREPQPAAPRRQTLERRANAMPRSDRAVAPTALAGARLAGHSLAGQSLAGQSRA